MEKQRGHCKAFLTIAFVFAPKFVLVARWLLGCATKLRGKGLDFIQE